MSCPTCNSSEWRLASLVYREGLSYINTVTSGSVSDGGSISARTSGTRQTAQSSAAAPPEDPRDNCVIYSGMAFFVLSLISGGWLGFSFFGLLFLAFKGLIIGIFIGWLYGKRKYGNAHQVSMAEWERKKMCLRCGCFYLYDAPTPIPPLVDTRNEVRPGAEPTSVGGHNVQPKIEVSSANQWQTLSATHLYVSQPHVGLKQLASGLAVRPASAGDRPLGTVTGKPEVEQAHAQHANANHRR